MRLCTVATLLFLAACGSSGEKLQDLKLDEAMACTDVLRWQQRIDSLGGDYYAGYGRDSLRAAEYRCAEARDATTKYLAR